MTYRKPEVTVLGDAALLIQGSKVPPKHESSILLTLAESFELGE
jgi:hypothetical protein